MDAARRRAHGRRAAHDAHLAVRRAERIDYVTVAPGGRVEAVYVPDTLVSEHRPVVAELRRKRIDYVTVAPGGRVEAVYVPDTLVSDHRPVVAELRGIR